MLRLDKLSVISGNFSLRAISFEIPTGSYAILMGNTGSGKTTLLESICGLRSLQSGSIFLADRNVTELPPRDRGIGYVPQDVALFNSMTVGENIGFALMLRKQSKAEISQRVSALASLLGIDALVDRYPINLSGGEKQRVALGRALAVQPQILLLDEPFSALDDQTREDMYALMHTVRSATAATVLHVTHSRSEAAAMGDLQFHLNEGRIVSSQRAGADSP